MLISLQYPQCGLVIGILQNSSRAQRGNGVSLQSEEVEWLSQTDHPDRLVVLAANCAGISGSQIFRTSDAPKYIHGLKAICAIAGASWILVAVLCVQYYIRQQRAETVDKGSDPTAID